MLLSVLSCRKTKNKQQVTTLLMASCLHFLVLADECLREVCDGDGVGGGSGVCVGGVEVEGEEKGLLSRREQQDRRTRRPARSLHAPCKLRYSYYLRCDLRIIDFVLLTLKDVPALVAPTLLGVPHAEHLGRRPRQHEPRVRRPRDHVHA